MVATIHIQSNSDGLVPIDTDAFEQFKQGLRGPVVTPEDSELRRSAATV